MTLHGEVLCENLRLFVVEVELDVLRPWVRTDVDVILDAVFDVLFVHQERCVLLHVLACFFVLVELREHAKDVASENVANGRATVLVDVDVADAVLVIPSDYSLSFLLIG